MKEILSTMTSKGQVTIPAEVRQSLGLKRGDKIAFLIDQEGDVHLKPPHYPSVASLRGAAGTLPQPLSWQEIGAIVQEERAEEFRDKLGKPAS